MSGHAEAKVFGIGLMKTGTWSLHEALGSLGYKSLHNGGLETMKSVQEAIREGRPMLTHLDPSFNAFADIFGITYYFYLADVAYPGSRFILTKRDLDDWLDSRRLHVEKDQRIRAAGKHPDAQEGVMKVDMDGWATEYTRHEAVVRAYFADRPDDLLVFDLIGGDGWEPLCEFLGQPVPEAPFPWQNRFEPFVDPAHRDVSQRL
jgi:Sulfotransferase domain